jgi:outer membrane protein OmpA-like peptidoglycan-associated protein
MRLSHWKFDNSATFGAGAGIFTGGGGKLWFKTDDGNTTFFYYGGVGFGLGIGLKLGKTDVNLGGSTTDMFNAGAVFMTDGFKGRELEPDDFTGFCTITDITVSAGRGGSATAMFAGMSKDDLLSELGYDGPPVWGLPGTGKPLLQLVRLAADSLDIELPGFMRDKAKALIVMAGLNAGTPSASISKSVGYVGPPSGGVIYIPQMPAPPPEDPPPPKVQYQAYEEGPPILLPGDALFDFDSSNLASRAVSALTAARTTLRRYPDKPLLIEGYTDSIGSDGYNLGLSKRRAESVKKWLTDQRMPNAMYARGYGKDPAYFVASNKTPSGRQRNRRVEITVMQSGWRPRA